MDIRTAERADWERVLNDARPPTFLQSWAWGEAQRSLGEDVIRMMVTDGKDILGGAQAVTVTARRAQFLHVPHGPVIRSQQDDRRKTEAAAALLRALRDEAERRHLHFLRVSPIQENTANSRRFYRALGFRSAPIHLHAERLWILDLAPTEELLLAAMRKTTRNLIRRADRDGITVRFSTAPRDLLTFLHLYNETARREEFMPFSPPQLEAELRTFSGEGNALLAFAEHRGQRSAAAMIPFTPWSAFYHHGASARHPASKGAAQALQWAVIREAKRRGCREYNFWGVAPTNGEGRQWHRHPWAGLTLFKKGFGGREVPLVPTQDLPLSSRYWAAYFVDAARRWKRQRR